jgi:hypothetical protein
MAEFDCNVQGVAAVLVLGMGVDPHCEQLTHHFKTAEPSRDPKCINSVLISSVDI